MTGLRDLVQKDLGFIMETDKAGARWPITVTDPSGAASTGLYGLSGDISQVIDPDTGQIISGRLATVSIRISALSALGLGIPQGIEDNTKKPWIVTFNDINGNSFTFKVAQSSPDRGIGFVNCTLEQYTP